MFITSKNGEIEYQSSQEILNHIHNNRSGVDEFWISKTEKYPCIHVALNGEYAAVTFFSEDSPDCEMWLSYNADNETEVEFIAGEIEWTPDSHAVISLDEAFSCIKEYLSTNKRPSCIEWQEL